MEEVDIVIIVLKKLLLSILYGRSCYCQYCIQEAVIVNIAFQKLFLPNMLYLLIYIQLIPKNCLYLK